MLLTNAVTWMCTLQLYVDSHDSYIVILYFVTFFRLNMDICKYLVLDEGDRMLDLGFDEEVRFLFTFFLLGCMMYCMLLW